MKTKQITLENIKNKEELKDYIIDPALKVIQFAIPVLVIFTFHEQP